MQTLGNTWLCETCIGTTGALALLLAFLRCCWVFIGRRERGPCLRAIKKKLNNKAPQKQAAEPACTRLRLVAPSCTRSRSSKSRSYPALAALRTPPALYKWRGKAADDFKTQVQHQNLGIGDSISTNSTGSITSSSNGGAGTPSKSFVSLLRLASLLADWATARGCSHFQNFVTRAILVDVTLRRTSSSQISQFCRHRSIFATFGGHVSGTSGFCNNSSRSSRGRKSFSHRRHCWSVG